MYASSVASCLSKSPGGHVISFPIKPWVAFGLPYPLIDLFTLVCLWCGRTVARSVYGHMITKFSRMGRLPHFLSYGAPPTRGAKRRAWRSAIWWCNICFYRLAGLVGVLKLFGGGAAWRLRTSSWKSLAALPLVSPINYPGHKHPATNTGYRIPL